MADVVQPNYFTCTLGEARRWKEAHPSHRSFSTVIDLINTKARDKPQLPAIGFSIIGQDQTKRQYSFLTFDQLCTQSNASAAGLQRLLPQAAEKTVGLLCTSGFEFVFTWLGLARLGYTVLLLAPQLEGQAIEHLCRILKVETIFTDARQEGRCAALSKSVAVTRIPPYDCMIQNGTSTSALSESSIASVHDVAIFFHSSGTSTGLPKAIPQTHNGLVAALPTFPVDGKPATFSTTPLYHGGLVDALRAWTSGAMIWYFPEGEAPITATNIGKAVQYAKNANAARLGYFSSVPYILQMLADEEPGLELLRSMDLVGVGGAALPEASGDRLVKAGVNLLSRMGSAECGFLMSSHRDYNVDKDWQFLRPIDDSKLLAFEPREDGLSELVVGSDWPHLAKVNREDGSYATSDLFEPHQNKSRLWRYHSRADAQLTLSNGKKFDPSPMEASILASAHLLMDVLIFGDGRNYPGILLLLSDESADGVIETVWPIIERLNKDTQNHARISKSMVLVAEPRGQPGLEKSSKGTILRRQAEARFAKQIEQAYSQHEERNLSSTASYDELHSVVTNCFAKALGRHINVEQDLYGQGVDSISCIQIRVMIQNCCLPADARKLPLNVVYDKATVCNLVSYVWNLRKGLRNDDSSEATLVNGPNDTDRDLQTMRDLAAKYTMPLQWLQEHDSTTTEVVVLTGSTGFLGSHILRLLLTDNQVKLVICLVRASSKEQAQSRIETTLRSRGHNGSLDHRVVCAPCDLNQKDLGLTPELRELLSTKSTLFIHSAWTVNFSLHISSFEDQIRGTANMLNAAAEFGARMVFISSTAAVSEARHALIPESISLDPKDASPLGYSQSKWVAEQICAAATDRDGPSDASSWRDAVVIIRVGQLCGDERGAWNRTEAYPLMLSTAKIIGSLPSITGEVADWLSVHLAARAVLDVAAHPSHAGHRGSLDKNNFFHVFNHHNTPSWDQMLRWLQEDNNSKGICAPFEIVPASHWVSTLENAAQKEGKRHPAYALLGLWKKAFGSRDSMSNEQPAMPSRFDNSRSQQVSSVMSSLQPLDQEELVRMWRWVNQTLP